ncbi:MAG: glycosyltransferase family 39 protein [Anaerolineae bacterium]
MPQSIIAAAMSESVPRTISGVDRVEARALPQVKIRWLCALIVLGVTAAALAIRWPYLLLVPRLTDETVEADWAMQVVRGENYPLTLFHAHIGAVHTYLLAFLFRVFGLHAALPRAVSTIFGALLAGLTAWLAWQFAIREPRLGAGGRARPPAAAALLAGGLVATSFPLAASNSHIGWANCLTPFFATLALGLTWLGVVDERPWWLVLSGFVWAIALQTHPTALGVLPGVALWFVIHPTGRRWLRTRWPWLTAAAFAVGYGNMIWYNVATRGGSLAAALDAGNANRVPPTLIEHVVTVGSVFVQLGRMVAGAYAIQPDGEFPTLITPATIVCIALALLALIWAARSIQTAILPLAVVSGALTLPLITDNFEGFYDARYIDFMLPLVYLALALAAVSVWEAWRGRTKAAVWTLGDTVFTLAAAVLVALPLLSLARFYGDSERYGLTNAPFIETAAEAHSQAGQGVVVVLDRETSHISLSGGGNTRRALEYLLTMNGTNFRVEPVDNMRWLLDNSEAPMFVILSDASYGALVSQYPLTPTTLHGSGFGAYTARAAR